MPITRQPLTECIIVNQELDGVQIVAKNRDRAYKPTLEVVHELISHGGEIDLWTDEELEKWKAPDFKISDDAKAALSDRVWDYYVARATDSIPKARRE